MRPRPPPPALLRPRRALPLHGGRSTSTGTGIGSRARTGVRPLVAPPPPTPATGPLMERRADRALPPLPRSPLARWLKTLPVFFAVMAASTLAIFNYQKAGSSVVGSTLYALRMNPRARALLGDAIYFRDRFPWIWGELNQLHGRVDIGFGVKGTRGRGYMRFRSVRKGGRMGRFETQEWSLELEDGTVVQLLEDEATAPLLDAPSSQEAAARQGQLPAA